MVKDLVKKWSGQLGKAMRQVLIDEYGEMGIPKGHPSRKIGPIYVTGKGGKVKKYEGTF